MLEISTHMWRKNVMETKTKQIERGKNEHTHTLPTSHFSIEKYKLYKYFDGIYANRRRNAETKQVHERDCFVALKWYENGVSTKTIK